MYLNSKNWKEWSAHIDLYTCPVCRNLNGKIFAVNDKNIPRCPNHINCRCFISALRSLIAGTATRKGKDGADWELFHNGCLPDYYITKSEAKELGWISLLGNLAHVAPGKMIGGEIYHNKSRKLPDAPNRIWYEADINYTWGYRGLARILYSNDGLIFVSYTHYTTFVEIIGEESDETENGNT